MLIFRSIGHTCASLLIGFALPVHAATDIELWHSLPNALGDQMRAMAERFNKEQSDYRLLPIYVGSDMQALKATDLAIKAGRGPHLLEAADLSANGIHIPFRPVGELLESADRQNLKSELSTESGYHDDDVHKLQALPLMQNTAVFYYNKDAFRKVGLDPEAPPKTWSDMQTAAGKLRNGDWPCSYTSSWESWMHIENLSAAHKEPYYVKTGGVEQFSINKLLQVRHVSRLSSWVKSEYYTHAGRRNEADARFVSGECAMLTSSSSAYAAIRGGAKFDLGMARLPMYEDIRTATQYTTIDGNGLWVLNGRKADDYKGVAKVLGFFARPEIQAEWHQQTGFLPMTPAAYELTARQGFYRQVRGMELGPKAIISKEFVPSLRALSGPLLYEIRSIVDEELEYVWQNLKPPKQALDNAVARINSLLRIRRMK